MAFSVTVTVNGGGNQYIPIPAGPAGIGLFQSLPQALSVAYGSYLPQDEGISPKRQREVLVTILRRDAQLALNMQHNKNDKVTAAPLPEGVDEIGGLFQVIIDILCQEEDHFFLESFEERRPSCSSWDKWIWSTWPSRDPNERRFHTVPYSLFKCFAWIGIGIGGGLCTGGATFCSAVPTLIGALAGCGCGCCCAACTTDCSFSDGDYFASLGRFREIVNQTNRPFPRALVPVGPS